MRTILIDPIERSISEIEYNGDWRSIAPTIGADIFTIAYVDGGDLYLDDEGLFADPRRWFEFAGAAQPFVGRALLFGPADAEGNSTTCTWTIDEVEQRVRWLSEIDVMLRLFTESA